MERRDFLKSALVALSGGIALLTTKLTKSSAAEQVLDFPWKPDNYYVGNWICWGETGQLRVITGYDARTRTCKLSGPWEGKPSKKDTFHILATRDIDLS